MDRLRNQHPITYLMWILLLTSALTAMWQGTWSVVFIALVTFALTLLPILGQGWADVSLPKGFVAAVIFFITGTLFLGEVGDFYERFWWWDVLLHTGSAVGFGMIGTVLVLLLVRGERMTVSPALAALLAFSFAVSIGAVWEIFEFSMDQIFGTNMQKSGLMDTMADLIVDCIGGAIGALAGYAYLAKGKETGLAGTIAAIARGFRLGRKP
ncbi:hypothetical protein [Marivita hallyeonensis]|uniref:Membrane protein YjdF n=1 Tax=Marivita hallyeonensis TaxID=996342 RepID=A0A1M5TWT2_9RHOB|nr:hypothetical protein [Marivita hallyeonensis]SHH55262.1 hypothetical protein SAMN05443551_2396 [Marivita hallyeonensis]